MKLVLRSIFLFENQKVSDFSLTCCYLPFYLQPLMQIVEKEGIYLSSENIRFR